MKLFWLGRKTKEKFIIYHSDSNYAYSEHLLSLLPLCRDSDTIKQNKTRTCEYTHGLKHVNKQATHSDHTETNHTHKHSELQTGKSTFGLILKHIM